MTLTQPKTLSPFILPSPGMPEGLFRIILQYFLIATIAVNGINIIWITATLATLLGPSGLCLNRQPRSTIGAEGRIREVFEMATGTGEVHLMAGTTLFAEF
jgi:hypothetical protein